jgi:hypothetical protein
MLLVFWAAGIFLTALAVRLIRQALKFGSSTVALDLAPIPLGGWASGVVRAPLAVLGTEVQLDVECVRSRGGRQDRTRTTLWRETRMLDGTRFAPGPGYVEVPFAVRLPAALESAGALGGGTVSLFGGNVTVDLAGEIDWYLRTSAKLPGVDWQESFTLPVAAGPSVATADSRPPREMPLLEGERLASRLPGTLETGPDADVLHFPLKLSFVLWPVTFAAAALLLPLARPQLAGLPDEAFFWARVVAAGLALLSLVGLLFDPRRIEVRPDAVRIRRGLMGVGVHRTLAREEVAAVDESTSTSNPPVYLVKIRLRGGRSYDVAPNIYKPDQAAALAARLRAILRVG